MIPITGTFLDEITHEIPSQNWGPAEWTRDFDAMTFFFGTYDSGKYWQNGQYEIESDINKAFCDEFMEKYGHRQAFGGWYISHEISVYNDGMMKVYETLAHHLRGLKPVPILILPYIKGVKQFGASAISLEQHKKE